MRIEIATHRERQGLSLWSLSFVSFVSFAFWKLARECTSTEGSFSPQWFLSFVYAVGCLCGLIINSVQKAIVGHDEVNKGNKFPYSYYSHDRF